MVSESWFVLLFTNHGLKDNQDEGDFFDEAALFYFQKNSLSTSDGERESARGSL
jgi:hypothetical protein